MAVFYLLPPRRVVGDHCRAFLTTLFPGLPTPASADLAETFTLAALGGDACAVFREDLPEDNDVISALRRDFGAEAGDEVVEVRAEHAGLRESRRWRIPRHRLRLVTVH